jgi:hypothetical protein
MDIMFDTFIQTHSIRTCTGSCHLLASYTRTQIKSQGARRRLREDRRKGPGITLLQGCMHTGLVLMNDFLNPLQEQVSRGMLQAASQLCPTDPWTGVDVRKAPLVFIPVLYGPDQRGHWALLVIDRTEYEPGIVVFFDSLPGRFLVCIIPRNPP